MNIAWRSAKPAARGGSRRPILRATTNNCTSSSASGPVSRPSSSQGASSSAVSAELLSPGTTISNERSPAPANQSDAQPPLSFSQANISRPIAARSPSRSTREASSYLFAHPRSLSRTAATRYRASRPPATIEQKISSPFSSIMPDDIEKVLEQRDQSISNSAT